PRRPPSFSRLSCRPRRVRGRGRSAPTRPSRPAEKPGRPPTDRRGPCCTCVEATARPVACDDEQTLIRAAQQGDRPAFATLAGRYGARLHRWLYHLTHDQHAAEDLTQETFLKAFAGLATFRAGTNLQAWLFRIAHNNFVNQRRSSRKVRQPFPEHLPSADEG